MLQQPQYLFLNRAPGRAWNQNDPASITDALFREARDVVGLPPPDRPAGGQRRLLGLSFIFSCLNGSSALMQETLRRLLAAAQKHDTPVLIALDSQNWWGYRADLWNWWDSKQPGYNPANAENVEWSGPGAEHALKIAWRNWGRQIRVLPPPNLAAPRFRSASRRQMAPLLHLLKSWSERLPPHQRHLFVGVKVGWEASIGVNAYYYPDGNRYVERSPADDPKKGWDRHKDFAGGLVPLGYAARQSLHRGKGNTGPITLADHEAIVSDYLRFLTGVCRSAGLRREQIFVHSGGQFPPWEKHYSHRVAVTGEAVPGWSLYHTSPDKAGDLADALAKAGRDDWCAAEWLPVSARTAANWANAYEKTLGFGRCRFVCVYNWESIAPKPEAIEGLRRALWS